MTIEIRPAHIDEYERVGQLTLDAYLALWPEGVGGYADVITAVAERTEHDEVWVAVADGVVGTITYVFSPASASMQWDDPDAAGFRLLAVDLDHQGAGVGRALFDAVLARARADGHPRVRLHSNAHMETALNMYERAGFVRDPAMDFTDSDHESVIGYVVQL